MTEPFEILHLCEEFAGMLKEIRYEAETRPGEGIVVETKLLEAAKYIDAAIKILEDVHDLICEGRRGKR